MELKYFDTSTPIGWKRAIKFEKDNPQYKLINSRLDFTWYFEKEVEKVSNCCSANLFTETDICCKCNEHCKPINI